MEDYSVEELKNIKDTVVAFIEDDETLYNRLSTYVEIIPLRFSYDLSSFTEKYINKTKHLFTYYFTLDNNYNNEILRLKKHFKHFMRYPKYLYINKNNQNYELIKKVCTDTEIELITNKETFINKVKA